jgi:RNA polymerase sigma factor (sigma-70 family)
VTGIEVAGFERATTEGRTDAPIDLLEWHDPHDLERVYLEHHLAVYRYLRARTHSDDEASELAAVVFERALAALGRYKPSRSGPLAWLFTIARNVANDAGRSKRARASFTFRLTESEPDPPDPKLTEDELLDRERLGELRARVARLPETQREAIVLRYAGGLSAREIGATLGKSEAATQKLLSRALTTLREAYRDDA